MKEVRLGMTTEALRNREIMEFYPEECAFSIIFGDNFETMDLIATSADEANIWVTGLTCLMNANAGSKGCKCKFIFLCSCSRVSTFFSACERLLK